jgi:hypothetical protein
MRAFWNAQDLPYQISQAVLDPQVVLAVHKVASCAASTGVANLEAAPEVRKNKLIIL